MIWFAGSEIKGFTCFKCHKVVTRQGEVFSIHGWLPDELIKMKDPWYFTNRILKLEQGLIDVMYVVGHNESDLIKICYPCMTQHAKQIQEIIDKVV